MKWTEKQSQVIEKRESNILVSAAAGSGKTAVLVERIKQLIIKDGVPIDEILVVTFTKAAASEMKEKIVK
ncbi:MAG: UvrD-helicase domain-containing protein, partial [Anaerovoracaceae bacterium]